MTGMRLESENAATIPNERTDKQRLLEILWISDSRVKVLTGTGENPWI